MLTFGVGFVLYKFLFDVSETPSIDTVSAITREIAEIPVHLGIRGWNLDNLHFTPVQLVQKYKLLVDNFVAQYNATNIDDINNDVLYIIREDFI